MIRLVWLGARTRFAGPAEWLSTALAVLAVTAVTGGVWTAAHPDGSLRTQALLGWMVALCCASRADEWLITRHLDGRLVVDLARPIAPPDLLLLRDAGRVAAGIAAIGLPMALVVFTLFPPTGLAAPRIAAFAASIGLAALAAHGVALGLGTVAVQLGAPPGTTWLKSSVLALLSGAAVPPAVLPEPWRSVALASPFAALAGAPAAILLGVAPAGALVIQAGWTLVIVALARAGWRAVRAELGSGGG